MAKPPKTPPPAPIRSRASEVSPAMDKASSPSPKTQEASPPDPLGADAVRVEAKAGPASLKIEVNHTPAGLLALSACVTSILLGAAAIVWISTGPARQHPIATAWTLRRKS